MKYTRFCRSITALLLVVLLLAAMLPCTLADDSTAEADAVGATTGSINYIFQIDDERISGVNLRLYLVGTINEDGTCTLPGATAECFNNDGTIKETTAASVLTAKYDADANTRKPLQSGTTDSNGVYLFSGLEKGIYLITGDSIVEPESKVTYWPTALLVSIPGIDIDQNQKQVGTTTMNRTVYAKPVKNGTTVKKVWKNDTASNRPTSIEVELKAEINGETKVIDTVKLTADTNWSYTWDNLDPNIKYTVNEKSVPSGYTVTVEGMVITNTYKSSSLPKTGLIWWPAIVLAIAGILCIAFGLSRRRRNR